MTLTCFTVYLHNTTLKDRSLCVSNIFFEFTGKNSGREIVCELHWKSDINKIAWQTCDTSEERHVHSKSLEYNLINSISNVVKMRYLQEHYTFEYALVCIEYESSMPV